MHNPWVDLPSEPPYILLADRPSIFALKKRVVTNGRLDHAINEQSIPEPFIGNPYLASVILLNLNPGDSDEDAKAHNDPAFRHAMLHNLRHEEQEYPFYPLNPTFAWTACGKWWTQHLKSLFTEAGLQPKVVAQRLCVIEWFPYHSRRAGLPSNPICASQQYSFEMAKQALNDRKIIVGMRARKRWAEVDRRFDAIPYLSSVQNPIISPRNAGQELFTSIVRALQHTTQAPSS
jgi:hypothetical protein